MSDIWDWMEERKSSAIEILKSLDARERATVVKYIVMVFSILITSYRKGIYIFLHDILHVDILYLTLKIYHIVYHWTPINVY